MAPRRMPKHEQTYLVEKVEATWTSGATVTLQETIWTKYNPDTDEHDDVEPGTKGAEWDMCCGRPIQIEMSSRDAPVAGAHVRLTIEQVA